MPIKKLKIRHFFSPYFLDEYSIYKAIKSRASFLWWTILDIWCRNKPYINFFKCKKYLWLDIVHWKDVDIVASATSIPLDDSSIDSIFSTQVITDIYDIDNFFLELKRVLKNGWTIFFTTEFICGKNDIPHDYYRFTDYFLKKKLIEYWFKNISIQPTSDNFYTAGYTFNLAIWKVYIKYSKNIIWKLIFPFIILIISITNIKSLLFSMILPKNNDLTLWFSVLANKK